MFEAFLLTLHKCAQFLKCRFCYATPALAGPGRFVQSAQKEARLARRRGGGPSALRERDWVCIICVVSGIGLRH